MIKIGNRKMAETSDGFISTKETRKLIGVTTATLINWSKEGKIGFIIDPSGVRLYNKKDVHNIVGRNIIPPQKEQICYCRVSTRKQMDDLERQKDFFKEKFPTYTLVTDIGSGLNWKRKGLQTILERAMSGVVEEVVVAHRDRLCRFGFELLKFIFKSCKVKLHVCNNPSSESSEADLADDILSIVHVYSCRNMGRRRYSKVSKDQIVSKQDTEDNTETVDGNM
jgi:predicted site-specific integrase-resolvase